MSMPERRLRQTTRCEFMKVVVQEVSRVVECGLFQRELTPVFYLKGDLKGQLCQLAVRPNYHPGSV